MHEKCHRETRAGSEDGEGALESSQRGNSRFLACGGTLRMPSFGRSGVRVLSLIGSEIVETSVPAAESRREPCNGKRDGAPTKVLHDFKVPKPSCYFLVRCQYHLKTPAT